MIKSRVAEKKNPIVVIKDYAKEVSQKLEYKDKEMGNDRKMGK